MQYRSFFIFIFLLTLWTCHKDTENIIDSNTSSYILEPSFYKGDILGYVYDEENNPVENVVISYGVHQTFTDANGLYSIKAVELNRKGTYIKASKQGYLFGSDLIYPTDAINQSFIQLLKIRNTRNFNSTSGATIDIDQGGSIKFDPSSIVSKDGSAYTGIVYVTALRLATDDPDLENKMPGALTGIDITGQLKTLATLGMVAVELQDAAGNELNLAPKTQAEITFPVSPKDLAAAPATIPLWHFDEQAGIWVEEEEAVLQGTDYVGSVSHFSFWNCDIPFDLVEFCVQVVYQNGLPAERLKLEINTNSLGSGYGYTDSKGKIFDLIPKDEPLQIIIKDPFCDIELYSAEIGPFDQDVALENIVLNLNELGIQELVVISGQVLCDGETQENSTVVLKNSLFPIMTATDENGFFTIEIPASDCPGLDEGEIFAYNSDSNIGSGFQDLDLTNGNLPNLVLEVCESSCDIQVEFELSEYDTCGPDFPNLSLTIIGGVAPYLVEWNDGSQGPFLDFVSTGTYEVTVTDATNLCSKIATFDAEVFINIVSANPLLGIPCVEGEGAIYFNSISGVPPFEINMTGPNGFTSNQAENDNLFGGTYAYTITDNLNCQGIGEVIIDTSIPEIQFEESCEDHLIELQFDPDGLSFYTFSTSIFGPFTQDINSDGIIFWNILETGYDFTVNAVNPANGCTNEEYRNYRVYEGLTVEAQQSPSCQGCDDGYIEAVWDNTQPCDNCVVENIKIYKQSSDQPYELGEDVTNQNENQNLSAGLYLVALYSTDNCILEFENIEL